MCVHCLGSLTYNQICGVNYRGEGTYITEGVDALCEVAEGEVKMGRDQRSEADCDQYLTSDYLRHLSHGAPMLQEPAVGLAEHGQRRPAQEHVPAEDVHDPINGID